MIHSRPCPGHFWVCHLSKYICFWCGITKPDSTPTKGH